MIASTDDTYVALKRDSSYHRYGIPQYLRNQNPPHFSAMPLLFNGGETTGTVVKYEVLLVHSTSTQ